MRHELPPDLQIPDQPRRLLLHRYQWGLPLLVAVPMLALIGLFGETWSRTADETAELTLEVEYASRYRYTLNNAVEVAVANRSDRALDTVVVSFAPEFMRQFSTVSFIPSATRAFEVELLELKPGETRFVWAELRGERYWKHRGSIQAYRAGGVDTARVEITSLVFP